MKKSLLRNNVKCTGSIWGPEDLNVIFKKRKGDGWVSEWVSERFHLSAFFSSLNWKLIHPHRPSLLAVGGGDMHTPNRLCFFAFLLSFFFFLLCIFICKMGHHSTTLERQYYPFLLTAVYTHSFSFLLGLLFIVYCLLKVLAFLVRALSFSITSFFFVL